VTSGRTNLTYRVIGSDGRSVALRRPGADSDAVATSVLPGVDREFRIISALSGLGFPVPAPVGVCLDPEVTGAPFAVVAWVEGRVVNDAVSARALSGPARAEAGRSFIDTLAALHAVNLDAAGLRDWARPSTYVARQLRAWREPTLNALRASSLPLSRTLQLTHEIAVAADLLATEPGGAPPDSLLHGDYRLDNVLLSAGGEVLSVLDWELSAVGNPLADLAYALIMWEPFDSLGRTSPTSVPGLSTSGELLDRYRAAAPYRVDAAQLEYHLAFAAWRSACIGAAVFARYERGVPGGAPIDSTLADTYISHYLARCFESHSRYVRDRSRDEER
jgi:aminoglycoside phosphotransferase (APT) family kinase protein